MCSLKNQIGVLRNSSDPKDSCISVSVYTTWKVAPPSGGTANHMDTFPIHWFLYLIQKSPKYTNFPIIDILMYEKSSTLMTSLFSWSSLLTLKNQAQTKQIKTELHQNKFVTKFRAKTVLGHSKFSHNFLQIFAWFPQVRCVFFVLLSCVEFLIWWPRICVERGGLLGFVECVTSLVLFPHSVNYEHHEEDCAEEADDSATYHRWKKPKTKMKNGYIKNLKKCIQIPIGQTKMRYEL